MADKKSAAMGAGIGASAVAAVALAIAAPVGREWEGRSLAPYKDPVGIWTVCDGATNVPMKTYTDAECDKITMAQYETFRDGVAKVTPGIEKEPWQWAAYTVFASNVGLGTYGKSSVRTLFLAKKYVEACRYLRNYKYAGGKVLQGLVYRREGHDERIGEYELCIVGAIPVQFGF